MAERPKAPSPPTLEQLIRVPAVLEVPETASIEKKADFVYRRFDGEALMMDVFAPAGRASGGKRPAVIFVHGGPMPPLALPPKDWGVFVGYGRMAAASGFVGITFNHRFFALDGVVDAESDVQTLVAFVRGRADEFGIDPDRIALWAFSGGGPLVSGFLSRPIHPVRALVFFYALMDLRAWLAQAKGKLDEATAARFSPLIALEKVKEPAPPVFIGRAGLDNPGLKATIDQFAALAKRKNLLLTLKNHPQGIHGFDVYNDDARTREIIRGAFEFLRRHLAPPA